MAMSKNNGGMILHHYPEPGAEMRFWRDTAKEVGWYAWFAAKSALGVLALVGAVKLGLLAFFIPGGS